MKSKIYILLLVVECLLACKKDEPVPTVLIDQSSSGLEISYTTAIIQWDIENDISVNKVIAEYTEDSTFSEFSQVSMTQTNNISSSKDVVSYKTKLTHLKEKTVYYLRYHVFNKYTSNTSGHFSFTTKARHTPNVQTENVTDVSYTTAKLHAQLLDWGTDTIPQVGFCLANHPNVSINDSCVKCNISTSTNAYSIILSSLKDSTKYYIRAYAKNSKGTAYGKEKSFTTMAFSFPTVTTSTVTNISYTSATCGGNVTSDGGPMITERGVCYSTTSKPTIYNIKVAASSAATGFFSCSLTGLNEDTKYCLRAYATNSKGTSYGEEVIFTTPKQGALSGEFSIGVNKKIQFSQGNLQYLASTDTWSFANYQYSYCGTSNEYIGTYITTAKIDLFGWGTGDNPTKTSINNGDYSTFEDWGENPISNGGNVAYQWRTLTYDEWHYLLTDRPNALRSLGLATVSGTHGLIILPDNWITPNGLSFNASTSKWSNNIYTLVDWHKMESNGAVFLPAAGYRGDYSYITGIGEACDYWSSTIEETIEGYAKCVSFGESHFVYRHAKSNGVSVRLVREVK